MEPINVNLSCDLQHPVKVQYLDGYFFSKDSAGHKINVDVFDNGVPVSIGGSVSADVIRSDGETVTVTGTVSGNRAYVILPATAYAVMGAVQVTIKVTEGTTIVTVASFVAYVHESDTDIIVDPGTIIPSVQALIAEIDEAVASIPADYSSLWTSLAPAFSTSTAYEVGQYVTCDGDLYRFTSAHAAGTWNSSHVERVTLGGELAKRAFIGRRNLTSSDDIDNITDPGTYGKPPEVSPDNWPFSASHQGRLNVFTPYKNSNTYTFVQTAFDAADNAFAFRTGRQDNWNGWVIVAGTNSVDELKAATEIQTGKNIANSVPWAVGGIASGVDTDYASRRKSDYIPLSDYDRITVSVDSGFLWGCAFYDAEKTYISERQFTTDTKTITPGSAAFVRFFMRNSSNTNMAMSDIRRIHATAYRKNNAEISNTMSIINGIRSISDDIAVGSWQIGYIYADGSIDIAGQPNYVCTMCNQRFPVDVYIVPDAGYQITVRLFDGTDTSVTYSTGWMTNAYLIPANTSFVVNASKTTPEAVGEHLAEYVAAIHFRTKGVEAITPHVADKKTKMAVLGDSISTYSGYIETGYNPAYYPTGDVTSVDRMWWKIVADEIGITDIIISAISQSAFYDYGEAMFPPIYDAGRIARIGTGGAPDVVFINAGTNDGFADQSASIVYSEDISTLEALPNSTVKGIALTIRRIQAAYPAAKIVLMIPKQVKLSSMQTGYNLQRVSKIADELVAYAEMFGVWKVIDLRKCGINQSNVASFCGDGIIHPNAKGMREMARYIISELK